MKKFVIHLFCFFSILTLNSCFELLQEVNLNPDGSGKMTLTLNLSQSKNKVATILMMESINGHKVPSKTEIEQKMNEVTANLKNIKGISNVSHSADFTNYIATLNFSFSNIEAVNNANDELLKLYNIKIDHLPQYTYNKSSQVFSLDFKNEITKTAYSKLKNEDKEVFKNATYTSIYRFPNSILKTNNANTKISKSGKATMQKVFILDIINNKTNISNQIHLSK